MPFCLPLSDEDKLVWHLIHLTQYNLGLYYHLVIHPRNLRGTMVTALVCHLQKYHVKVNKKILMSIGLC